MDQPPKIGSQLPADPKDPFFVNRIKELGPFSEEEYLAIIEYIHMIRSRKENQLYFNMRQKVKNP